MWPDTSLPFSTLTSLPFYCSRCSLSIKTPLRKKKKSVRGSCFCVCFSYMSSPESGGDPASSCPAQYYFDSFMLFVFNRLKQIRSAWEHSKAWNINGFSADGGETGVDVELKTFEEGFKKKKAEGLRLYSEFLQRWGGEIWLFESWSAEVRASQNCSKCFTLSFIGWL